MNEVQAHKGPLRKEHGMTSSKRLLPTGECWCGCGAETSIGSFFLPGHDKAAEAAVISLEYGGAPRFLVQHGYGPEGKNPKQEMAKLRPDGRRGGRSR